MIKAKRDIKFWEIYFHVWLQTFRNDFLIFMFGLRVILELITQFSKIDNFLFEKLSSKIPIKFLETNAVNHSLLQLFPNQIILTIH